MRTPPLSGLPVFALPLITLLLALAGPVHAQSAVPVPDAPPAAVDGAIIRAPSPANAKGKLEPAPGAQGPAGAGGVETRYLRPPPATPSTSRGESCGAGGSSMAAQRAGCAGDAKSRDTMGHAPRTAVTV